MPMPGSQTLSKLLHLLILACAFLLSFAGVALAAGAVEPSNGSLLDLARPVLDYFLSGHYAVGSAAALVLLVAVVRRYGAPHVAFLRTDVGGALLTLFGALGAAFVSILAGGAALSLAVVWHAIAIAVGAAGGYTLLNKLLTPLEAKAPPWLAAILRVITWIFDQPEAAAAKATADGAAAVAAKPAEGVQGVVGEITELK